jgi:hypothetical protein
MEDRNFYYKISPEVISGDIFKIDFTGDSETTNADVIHCCDIFTSAVTKFFTGQTYVYSSMTEIVSGGTSGYSLLTGLTIPIFITENTIDIGYYSAFDGMVTQKDTITNFLFSATTLNPNTYFFYNTSDIEFKKFLSFSNYDVDWGDGSPVTNITTTSPNFYSHNYASNGDFTITMSGMSPWGINIVKKDVTVPYTDIVITNPKGTAYFTPSGGNWVGTLLMYDYIFSGDSICDVDVHTSDNYTTIPIIVSGYTNSSINDLEQYGSKFNPLLFDGRFKMGVPVTGSSESVGTFWGPCVGTFWCPTNDGSYTAYTINNIDYYDYVDGTTIFLAKSSGYTSDMLVCTAITKNEVLLNVIDEAEVQSDIFIERGKQSGLETIIRLGEVDNVGDLLKYGYGFFKVIDI